MRNYTKKGRNAENFMQISLLLKKIWYLKDSRNGHFAMHYSSFVSAIPIYLKYSSCKLLTDIPLDKEGVSYVVDTMQYNMYMYMDQTLQSNYISCNSENINKLKLNLLLHQVHDVILCNAFHF